MPPAQLTAAQSRAIEKHVQKHVGPLDMVLHEIFSDGIHLDVIPVEPSKKRPFKTFVTMGMSAVPMETPKGSGAPRRLELCVVLPPDWPTDDKSLARDDGRYDWPIGGLKSLARYPHEVGTYFDIGHTTVTSDPPKPFVKSCKFMAWMILPPLSFSPQFFELTSTKFSARVLQVMPIYREELEFKLKEGAEAMFDRFEAIGLDVACGCDPGRPNACKR